MLKKLDVVNSRKCKTNEKKGKQNHFAINTFKRIPSQEDVDA